MKPVILVALMTLNLLSCSKGGDERLAEKADINAREQINAQNANQKSWAIKMESDLDQRKHFMKAVAGEFMGTVAVNNTDFVIKAEMIPSIPITFSDRYRTLDEINFELQNLTLTIHVKIENPRVSNSAVSCTIEKHRPDIQKGLINIISTSCKNIFKFMLADNLDETTLTEVKSKAVELSRSVRKNEIPQIDVLNGLFESSVSTVVYPFSLTRI